MSVCWASSAARSSPMALTTRGTSSSSSLSGLSYMGYRLQRLIGMVPLLRRALSAPLSSAADIGGGRKKKKMGCKNRTREINLQHSKPG
uniref:Uncharacterized protein n=1 Tax=Aegilops tauschii subsp. strangulata TaxID=200361 RepID=A0A453MC19_AEGTS